MKQEERIEKMETIFDNSLELLEKLESILTDFENNQKQYKELFEYYYSEDWHKDAEFSNKEDFPKDLKCGVLSQDSIYNLIGDNHQVAIRMLELATKMIKYF